MRSCSEDRLLAGAVRVGSSFARCREKRPHPSILSIDMCNPRASLPSLVLFDIGGVVVPSPLLAINRYEIDHNLPPDYLNVSIRFRGETGAFQRFERGEIDLWDFYRDFGNELSQVREGNEWYMAWCRETGRVIPREEELPVAEGPRALKVDGRELFGLMMRHSTTPNELVVGAIERLRGM